MLVRRALRQQAPERRTLWRIRELHIFNIKIEFDDKNCIEVVWDHVLGRIFSSAKIIPWIIFPEIWVLIISSLPKRMPRTLKSEL
jgi:hypothetical protein